MLSSKQLRLLAARRPVSMARLPYRNSASLLVKPRPTTLMQRAWESTKTTTTTTTTTTDPDQDKDGHIEKASNESILWFDSMSLCLQAVPSAKRITVN